MALCRIYQAYLWHIAAIFERARCQYPERMKKTEKQPLAAEADKFMIRLPEGMRGRLADAAKANNRSMNAEVVARLEKTLTEESLSLKEAPDSALYGEIAQRAGENFTVEITIRSKNG